MIGGWNNGEAVGPTRPAGDACARLVPLLLTLGLAGRLYWLHVCGGINSWREAGEATRIALSLGLHGRFADAFYAGQGPTAHMTPIMPAIAGLIVALCGGVNYLSNLLLLAWAIAQTALSYLLLLQLAKRLGMAPGARLLGLGILCLLPVFVPQELIDFRYWEGGLAVCLAATNLLMLDALERGPWRLEARAMLLVAALTAFTFFLSPPTGLAIDACWALYALRRLPVRQTLRLALVAGAALAVVLGGWGVRNMRVLHEPILLRDNFGLELALGYDPATVSTAPSAALFSRRLKALHPYHGAIPQQAMRAAGGEAAYSRALATATRAWIVAHPGDFARLTLRHLAGFFFPREWQMQFSEWWGLTDLRAAIVSIVDALGLVGLAVGLARRRRGHGYLALYVALVALPYAIVQPVPRYTYLVFGLLAFLAARLVAEAPADLVALARRRRDRRAGHESAAAPACQMAPHAPA